MIGNEQYCSENPIPLKIKIFLKSIKGFFSLEKHIRSSKLMDGELVCFQTSQGQIIWRWLSWAVFAYFYPPHAAMFLYFPHLVILKSTLYTDS